MEENCSFDAEINDTARDSGRTEQRLPPAPFRSSFLSFIRPKYLPDHPDLGIQPVNSAGSDFVPRRAETWQRYRLLD